MEEITSFAFILRWIPFILFLVFILLDDQREDGLTPCNMIEQGALLVALVGATSSVGWFVVVFITVAITFIIISYKVRHELPLPEEESLSEYKE